MYERAQWKDCVVYAVAIQLISECGFATVRAVRVRLEQIGMQPARWDNATPPALMIRNSFNRLEADRLLTAVQHAGGWRWVDRD